MTVCDDVARDVVRLRRRRRARTVGTALTAAAIVVALAVAVPTGWDLWGTGRDTARAQAQLLAQLQAGIHTPIPTGVSADVNMVETSTMDVPDAQTDSSSDGGTPVGAPWALVRIDDADSRTIVGPYAVVSGVTDHHLTLGPGHYPSTPDPGEPGNVGIAGHRVTYGQPFHDLGDVDDGATVILVDRHGIEHRYGYHSTRVVRPGQSEVLDPDPTGTGRPTVTLTTCHPKFSDRERLVVHAIG